MAMALFILPDLCHNLPDRCPVFTLQYLTNPVPEPSLTNRPVCFLLHTIRLVNIDAFVKSLIGVGKDSKPPRPPNRACGSPAHGSPVGGFNIVIGTPMHGPLSW